MRKHDIKLVCFDLNKTLIKENTWQQLSQDLGVTPEEDSYYLEEFQKGKINYVEWNQIVFDLYKQRGRASYKNITQSMYRYNYMAGAKELVSYLHEQGYELVLISGAMDLLVERVGKELGINKVFANNKFIFDGNRQLSELITTGEDDQVKLLSLKDFANQLDIDLSECACIGDGDNDALLFKATERGITFEDSPIKNIAWKVVSGLSDIKNIL